MSRRFIIILAIILVIVVGGMVLSLKRALKAGAMANDPDPGQRPHASAPR